ncbi:unnamed protein product [Rangifer tarandus platyrhynchus]|uniref:Uncharacterized protein n=2 Tax=Rangifer tarandus platyrhynchus TaxID=3082113 RepID=A0AC59YS33_RANTA|nr:unnamed protein product [Rangifer tarandus platyrhynchus]
MGATPRQGGLGAAPERGSFCGSVLQLSQDQGWQARRRNNSKREREFGSACQLLLPKEIRHQNKVTVASQVHGPSCIFMNSQESLRDLLNCLYSKESGDNSFQ